MIRHLQRSAYPALRQNTTVSRLITESQESGGGSSSVRDTEFVWPLPGTFSESATAHSRQIQSTGASEVPTSAMTIAGVIHFTPAIRARTWVGSDRLLHQRHLQKTVTVINLQTHGGFSFGQRTVRCAGFRVRGRFLPRRLVVNSIRKTRPGVKCWRRIGQFDLTKGQLQVLVAATILSGKMTFDFGIVGGPFPPVHELE